MKFMTIVKPVVTRSKIKRSAQPKFNEGASGKHTYSNYYDILANHPSTSSPRPDPQGTKVHFRPPPICLREATRELAAGLKKNLYVKIQPAQEVY